MPNKQQRPSNKCKKSLIYEPPDRFPVYLTLTLYTRRCNDCHNTTLQNLKTTSSGLSFYHMACTCIYTRSKRKNTNKKLNYWVLNKVKKFHLLHVYMLCFVLSHFLNIVYILSSVKPQCTDRLFSFQFFMCRLIQFIFQFRHVLITEISSCTSQLFKSILKLGIKDYILLIYYVKIDTCGIRKGNTNVTS